MNRSKRITKKLKKYYLITTDKRDGNAIYNLAIYEKIKKNYEKAETYYLMTVDKEYIYAVRNFAIYYGEIKKITKN